MASLTRAYGIRGAAVALAMASVAGAVHGTMAAGFNILAVKIVVGIAGSVILVIGGAISARRAYAAAVAMGLAMALAFVASRWGAWALMTGGPGEVLSLFATPPWGWPGYLAARGISDFWMIEATSMLVPALIGCIIGHESADSAVRAGGTDPPG